MQSDAVTLTDAEKTRLLAEGVMGWTHSPETEITHFYWDGPRGFVHLASHWQPLINEAHAAQVRERMLELKCWWEIYMYPGYDRVKCWNGSTQTCASVVSPRGQLPRGICHAALLALELAKEEELNA